ncbi:protein-disulfide reductase DsbD domain-containing protein, partial [Lutibacter sp.]|uniref:protein-disulfide reductase DsbD domain-containing protein n=1 Tax=Lutibacter sp. TaxID=1925666 RepID=UPI0034A0495C
MKKTLSLLSFLLIFTASYAQIYDPVKWSTSVEKISDTEYDLIVKAIIEDKWHLYSQIVPEDGPIPTSFIFETTEQFNLVGNVIEEEGHTVYDPVFDMEIKYFENAATFKQRIKVETNNALKIIGELEFMVCDDTNCLPPTFVDLEFTIPGEKVAEESVDKKETFTPIK